MESELTGRASCSSDRESSTEALLLEVWEKESDTRDALCRAGLMLVLLLLLLLLVVVLLVLPPPLLLLLLVFCCR